MKSRDSKTIPDKILEVIAVLGQTPQSTGVARKYSSIITNDKVVSIDNGIEGFMDGPDLLWLFNMG